MSNSNSCSSQSQVTNFDKPILVYVVVRYGQVVGCYSKSEDATQIVNNAVAKGQLCDMIVRPLL